MKRGITLFKHCLVPTMLYTKKLNNYVLKIINHHNIMTIIIAGPRVGSL